MAGHSGRPGQPVTPVELAFLIRLTRDLAAAVSQGDLDRALELLEERRRTLAGLTWPEEADPIFWEQVQALRALEEELLGFCRSWRGVVEERLKALNVGHFLRMTYCPPAEGSRFIDVSK